MSKYTTEVRFICEHYAGLTESVGYNDIRNVIRLSRDKVFDFPYPIFDEDYRSVLETKILMHYYTREIALETAGLWKHFLDFRMNEIMPYYNKLYESELLEFNPFFTVDLTKDYTKQNDGTIKDTGTEKDNQNSTKNSTRNDTITTSGADGHTGTDSYSQWDVYSDTPQGALTNVDNNTYLTNARKIMRNGNDAWTNTYGKAITENESYKDTGTMNGTRTKDNKQELDNLESYLEHLRGKTPGVSYSKLLTEYRDTILNIDLQIINDLKDLFFNLW